MARHEHGTYEPSDEVRVFDGAEDEDDEEGSRLPLVIVGALLVLAMFGGLVWLAYSEGVSRGRTETPILAAAPGPARVAPAQSGGASVPYQGFKIYEQPAPPDDEVQSSPPAPPPQQQAAQRTAKAGPGPAPMTPPAPATAKPALAAVLPSAEPKPAVPASASKTALAPPPPMKKSVTPPSETATAAPRQLLGVAVATEPAPTPVAAPATAPAAVKGAYMLQIGAYKSQEDADAAWKAYKARHGALLSGFGSDVQKVDLGDKGTWYRLRIVGFADKDGAQATCDRLKSDGGPSCFLGK